MPAPSPRPCRLRSGSTRRCRCRLGANVPTCASVTTMKPWPSAGIGWHGSSSSPVSMSSGATVDRVWEPPASELYPQREDLPEHWSDQIERYVSGLPRRLVPNLHKLRFRLILEEVNRRGAALEAMSR